MLWVDAELVTTCYRHPHPVGNVSYVMNERLFAGALIPCEPLEPRTVLTDMSRPNPTSIVFVYIAHEPIIGYRIHRAYLVRLEQ
jgi:hypothetical protein